MIKLLLGGSPCTYWSIAQKNNRETEPSGIGWELFENYLIAKEKFKPDFFLYENNKSAAQAIKDEIKKRLNVYDGTLFMPDSGARYIEINSAQVSAQNRQRFYVHNCGEVEQPEDRGILLRDILESQVEEKYFYDCSFDFYSEDKPICAILHINGHDILKRVSSQNFKCPTLTTCSGGNTQKKVYLNGRVRKLTPIEYERLQTLPDDYTAGVSNTARYNALGNGWTAEVIIHILNGALKDIPRDEKIVVFSMYDGIGTGRYCLDKMGFKNVEYHAFEVDKYAIQIAQSNYPDIIEHGDAYQVRDGLNFIYGVQTLYRYHDRKKFHQNGDNV